MKPADKGRVIVNRSVRRRVLEQGPEDRAFKIPSQMIFDDHFDAQGLGSGLDDSDRLRMAILGDKEQFPRTIRTDDRPCHRHRFGGGGRFIEHRSVGQGQAGEIADHRLEIQQRFEPAL